MQSKVNYNMKHNVYDHDQSPCRILESNSLYNRHLLKLRNIYNLSTPGGRGKDAFNSFSKNQTDLMEERKRVKESQFVQSKLSSSW